jgi:hypothetical protein
MSAGDVLIFSRPITRANFRKDKFGTTMCALIHLTTRSKWNHAALDIGDGLMVEATSKGVAVNPIWSSDEIHRVSIPSWDLDLPVNDFAYPACSDGLDSYRGNDLEEVLAWSTGRVGWRYGYLTAALCGLRNMVPGWAIVQDRAVICSQLVGEALERAGHDFGKSTEKVSPGDLAEHFGVPRRG